jgi:hypothetical protein
METFALPTDLPRPRRPESRTTTAVTFLFNTFMVVSALLLTFVVLVREEQYALAQPDVLAAVQTSMGTANVRETPTGANNGGE